MTEAEALEVVDLLADTLPDEDDISRWIGEKGGPGWEWSCGSGMKDCGCPAPSFWKTVVTSPQWRGWERDISISMRKADEVGWDSPEAKQYKERMFDVDECAACGWMSQNHFQQFLIFCAERYEPIQKTEG